MANAANMEIREAAKSAGVCLWQIAERLDINDGNFSRKLRREFPPGEKKKIMDIIRDLADQKSGVT